LLGTPADRTRGRAVRGGHDTATVTVLVTLAGHNDVEVTRTLRRRGATTFAATANGQSLSEDEYAVLVSQAWSADIPLLDAVIIGPTLGGKTTGFPIRDHLAAVFGIEPLLRAAGDIKTRRDHDPDPIAARWPQRHRRGHRRSPARRGRPRSSCRCCARGPGGG
jgi:hypothetical protein